MIFVPAAAHRDSNLTEIAVVFSGCPWVIDLCLINSIHKVASTRAASNRRAADVSEQCFANVGAIDRVLR